MSVCGEGNPKVILCSVRCVPRLRQSLNLFCLDHGRRTRGTVRQLPLGPKNLGFVPCARRTQGEERGVLVVGPCDGWSHQKTRAAAAAQTIKLTSQSSRTQGTLLSVAQWMRFPLYDQSMSAACSAPVRSAGEPGRQRMTLPVWGCQLHVCLQNLQ